MRPLSITQIVSTIVSYKHANSYMIINLHQMEPKYETFRS